jgi:hypothetical protein
MKTMTLELTTRSSLHDAFPLCMPRSMHSRRWRAQTSIRSGLLLILRRYLKEQRAEAEARLKQDGKVSNAPLLCP